jgi:hypothetical protein
MSFLEKHGKSHFLSKHILKKQVDADSFEISHQYCFYLFRIKRENMEQMCGVTTNPNLVLGGGFRELARFTCLEDVNSYQNNLTGFTESDNIYVGFPF